VSESERLPYLGMTIVKSKNSFEINMKTYIEETIQLYVKRIREYVVPAMQALFNVKESKPVNDKMKFHSIVTKLLYLGKRGRPEILMPVQFLCTRVKCGWRLRLPPHGVLAVRGQSPSPLTGMFFLVCTTTYVWAYVVVILLSPITI
jgi:hypothetical protein